MSPEAQILIDLEFRLIRRGDKALASLIDEDFEEFGRSGRIWHRADVLEVLGAPTRGDVSMERAKVRFMGADTALCSYESVSPAGRTLRSSLWVRRAEGWRIVFHQGTPAQPIDAGDE